MSLSAQIIDQRGAGIVQQQSDAFDNELRVGIDEPRRRSVAFVFLVAKAAFDLTDEQTLDGIVDGGDDFGVDALYCDSPEDGEIRAARDLVDRNSDGYLARAQERIAGALEPLFGGRGRQRTLQRLSATFRRADLVETLLEAGERAPCGRRHGAPRRKEFVGERRRPLQAKPNNGGNATTTSPAQTA